MLKSLSALAISAILVISLGSASAQECPLGTFGVFFDLDGQSQTFQPIQNQPFTMYVILWVEAPVAGAAWKIEMSSYQYAGELVGPPGPNCQPPWCQGDPDPPLWDMGWFVEGAVALGTPWEGVRQGFGTCIPDGLFGLPILLGTIILYPWADVLESIVIDVTVVAEDYEGLVYADCAAMICDNATAVISHIAETVVKSESQSWGSVKALYR